jgi:tellurium resistance protein TerD
MGIVLKRGQKIDLTKGNSSLKKLVVGLGWDTSHYDGGHELDLDVSVFMCGASEKVEHDEDFIFYNNLKHASGSVEHMGDNRTGDGDGDGDDEQIKVDLSEVPMQIQKMAFTVTINDAITNKQNFGQVSNSYVRVVDAENGNEILKYDLGEDFSVETALTVCEIYRNNGEWKFNAVGSGFSGGLAALCKNYGLEV